MRTFFQKPIFLAFKTKEYAAQSCSIVCLEKLWVQKQKSNLRLLFVTHKVCTNCKLWAEEEEAHCINCKKKWHLGKVLFLEFFEPIFFFITVQNRVGQSRTKIRQNFRFCPVLGLVSFAWFLPGFAHFLPSYATFLPKNACFFLPVLPDFAPFPRFIRFCPNSPEFVSFRLLCTVRPSLVRKNILSDIWLSSAI